MCGINGFVGDFGHGAGDLIAAMNAAIAHRGPDDEGAFLAPGVVGLGHRRLSILDLSAAGHQPMADPEGLVQLVFNGEIYNYPELRRELEGRGYRFRSRTDTEALIYLYLEHGEGMLRRLNGMFAFAIWDRRDRSLFAARDHFGIKPFYYATLGDRLIFSSEVKGLLACPEVPRELNPEALADFLSFLWVADPLTMFRGVSKLPPGHRLRWKGGRVEVEPWWDLDGIAEDPGMGEAEAVDGLRDRFDAAVGRQLLSDVPVGAFLSGGLDSSGIVAAMARRRPGEVRCYTIALDPGDNAIDRFADDLPYARRVAAHLGVRLDVIEVRPDIADLWPEMVWHLDEPVADPAAINCYLIARLARRDGTKVLLSGQGADELFAGYRWHLAPSLMQPLARLPRPLARTIAMGAQWLPAATSWSLGGTLRRARKLLAGSGLSPQEQFALYSQWTTAAERRSLLREEIAPRVEARDTIALTLELLRKPRHASPLGARLYRDQKTFLPALNLTYTDKATMMAGVEARVPYLDVELAEFAATIPAHLKLRGRTSKYVLRKALEPDLPPEILTRSKSGFGVPLRRWIRHDLRELVDDLLSEEVVNRRGLFRWERIRAMRKSLDRGTGDYAYPLWAMMTLELWQRRFLDPAPTPAPRRREGPPVLAGRESP